MAKDPAFLFYPKDWLEGTADISAQAKGVYIDLLAYQHQRGDLPTDPIKLSRLTRLNVDEFNEIWPEISCKFEANGDRMVNRKLTEVVTERYTVAKKNKLIGTFAHVLRKLNLSKSDEKILKSRFNVAELMQEDTEWSTERLTEWCKNGVPFIKDANEDINKDINKDIITTQRQFYNSQIEESGDNETYISFIDYIFGENDLNETLDVWLALENQLTYENFLKLINEFGSKKMKDKLMVAVNQPSYLKGKKDFYLTLNNWCNREFKK